MTGSKKWKRLAALLLAGVMCFMTVPAPKAAAEEEKTEQEQKADPFADSKAVKGFQGTSYSTEKYNHKHVMVNFWMADSVATEEQKKTVEHITYKGKDYCFPMPEYDSLKWNAYETKDKGQSLTVVFLMGSPKGNWYNRSEWLIDDAARDGGGHTFYALKTDGAAGEWLEAFFYAVCKYMSDNDVKIDNFVLGNEVNMPDQWNYSGSTDAQTNAEKYAKAFLIMYNVVNQYSEGSRCSISLDHSWNDSDDGRGIAARDYLTRFASYLDSKQAGVNWCVATHLYPAILYEPEIWKSSLNPLSEDARFIDGKNLSYMTEYIKKNFGEQHRVMLTEQGFTKSKGEQIQAASLAYSYYAAMYDPMVDCFLLYTDGPDDTGRADLDFRITGTLAEKVYEKIGNGNPEDQEWIAKQCLPVIGVSSWADIIPNYPSTGIAQGSDGGYYYYVNGVVDETYTGIYNDSKFGMWYIKDGAIDFSRSGFEKYNDSWWAVAGGRAFPDYTGLWCDDELGWWYVEKGRINTAANLFVEFGGSWWCIYNGAVALGYTGIWGNAEQGFWYVENGAINFSRCGLNEFFGDNWCVFNGAVMLGYTGLMFDDNEDWWYIENGKVNYTYNGQATGWDGTVCEVKNGKVVQ